MRLTAGTHIGNNFWVRAMRNNLALQEECAVCMANVRDGMAHWGKPHFSVIYSFMWKFKGLPITRAGLSPITGEMWGGSWTPALWLFLDCGRNGSDGKMGGRVTWLKPSFAERWPVSWGPGGQAGLWLEFNWMTPVRPISCSFTAKEVLPPIGLQRKCAFPQIYFHLPSRSLILIALKHPERYITKWIFLSSRISSMACSLKILAINYHAIAVW